MNPRRRRIAAGLLALTGSATVVALLVSPAQAQAPDVTAWWNAANVGNVSSWGRGDVMIPSA